MALPEPYLRATVEEYLRHERESPERCEYLDGQIYQMAGESLEHSTINANVTGRLMMRLLGKPCRVLSPNMKIRTSRNGLFSYPDAAVVCGDAQFHDNRRDIVTNPTVIIEVLSPSTESYDRAEKFFCYQQLESLIDYLLIAQDEPRIEHFTRQPNGQWLYALTRGLDASVYIASLECRLKLAEVYDRIEFPQVAEEPAPPVS
jgi:Uma2 family endonuclease